MTKGIKKYLAVFLAVALCLSGFGGAELAAKAEGEVLYEKVTDLETIQAGGEFVLVAYYSAEDAYYAMDSLTKHSTKVESVKVSVENGVATVEGEMPVWTIAASGNGISVLDNQGDAVVDDENQGNGYLGWDVENDLSVSADTAYEWTVEMNEEGLVRISTDNGARALGFRYNVNNKGKVVYRWGPWAIADATANPDAHALDLMLFKATVAEEPTEAPTEEPTEAPTEGPTEEPTEAPTEGPTEESTENIGDVETGDSAQMILWALAMIVAVAAVAVVLNKKRCA